MQRKPIPRRLTIEPSGSKFYGDKYNLPDIGVAAVKTAQKRASLKPARALPLIPLRAVPRIPTSGDPLA
jgi:hypothetical protein